MYWQIFWNNYCSSRCNFCILGCGVEKNEREREREWITEVSADAHGRGEDHGDCTSFGASTCRHQQVGSRPVAPHFLLAMLLQLCCCGTVLLNYFRFTYLRQVQVVASEVSFAKRQVGADPRHPNMSSCRGLRFVAG